MSDYDYGMTALIGLVVLLILILQAVKNRIRMRAERIQMQAVHTSRGMAPAKRAAEERASQERLEKYQSLSRILSEVVRLRKAGVTQVSRAPEPAKTTKCTNCGAPKRGAYCDYCGT